MRPTLRGLAVLAVVALALSAAAVSGQRSLNAVAAPLLGAVAYGAVQCWWADPPTVTVDAVRPGHPGDERTVRISLEGSGVVGVAWDWPAGIEGEPVDAVLALPETVTAEVRLAERGVHDLDGLTVSRRDSLGLVRSPASVTDATTVVVYPEVHAVAGDGALSALLADERQVERQEFDRLREYEAGDPLRRIHWKTSAKRDEFFVVEFASGTRQPRVTVAAEAAEGRADEMAAAAATVALHALGAGLDVGLVLPTESVPAGGGEAHRANLLSVLARAEAGRLTDADRAAADVSVVADDAETTVRMGERATAFASLLATADADPGREVTAP